jgi:hypothetical protein
VSHKVNFRKDSGNGGGKRKLINLREPIWTEEDGTRTGISQLAGPHLQHIERWLRGGGKTLPARGAFGMWYTTIRGELDKRGLSVLGDHEEAYKRDSRITYEGQEVEDRAGEDNAEHIRRVNEGWRDRTKVDVLMVEAHERVQANLLLHGVASLVAFGSVVGRFVRKEDGSVSFEILDN